MKVNLKLQIIFRLLTLHKAQILRDDLIKDQSSQRRLDRAGYRLPLRGCGPLLHAYHLVQADHAVLISQKRLIGTAEEMSQNIDRCTNHLARGIVACLVTDHILHPNFTCVKRRLHLLLRVIYFIIHCGHAFIFKIRHLIHRQIINTKYHILRRNRHRSAVGRL